MKTRTSLILLGGLVGVGFATAVAIVDGHWGWESTGWLLFVAFMCLLIIVINKLKK